MQRKKKNVEGSSSEMDTSMPVWGERPKTVGYTMDTGAAMNGNTEERPRWKALEIALAVDLVVKDHTQ